MKKILLATTILALGNFASAVAYAQDAETVAEEADRGLKEIVVTAQRKSESAQRAAVAIDVVSADELLKTGIVTAASLNAAVPALVITKAGGANTSFYVRGVGNFTVNAYADPAIAFNVDGVYLGRPTSTTGTFFDLERVEVLKGPQGTLYGRNATGGAVNVIPKKPQLGEFSGYGSVGYGRFNALDVEAAINVPMGDNGALRIAAKVVDSKGYNDDGTNDEVGHAVRVQMMAELTDALTVRVAGDYSHQGGNGPGPAFNGGLRYTPGSPASATSVSNYTYTPFGFDPYGGLHTAESRARFATLVIGGAFVNPEPYLYPYLNNDYYGANAEINLDTGIGKFTFIPAYRSAKLDMQFNGPAFRAGLVAEKDEQFSAELRLDGKSIGPVDWLVGGYYFDETIRGRYTFSQYAVNVYQQFTTGTKSNAAFGRLTVNISDKFRLVAGARYTEDEKRFNSVAESLVQICTRPAPPAGPGCFGGPSVPVAPTRLDLPISPIPVIPGPPNSVAFGTFGNRLFFSQLRIDTVRPFNKVTYRLAAEYDIAPASLLYATYETGYRGGGFSNSIGHETYDPEFITAITLGSKNRLFDNKLQLNIEAFHWKYRNQQVSHFGFDTNGNSSLFTENIGRSTIKGIDVDMQWLATPTTLLRGSVQYLDNKLDSFLYTNPRGGTNLPPVTGCRVTDGTEGVRLIYNVDCSGLRGFNSPEWSANFGIEQSFEMGSTKIVLTGDGRYRSDRVVGFENLPQQHSGSDTTFDASIKFGDIDDQWGITAYVRNITDEAVPVLTQYGASTGGSISTQYAPPRTFGLRATMKF